MLGGHVLIYLGSTCSFIAAVVAATAYAGQGANTNVEISLGGIITAGNPYALVGTPITYPGSN